MEILGKYFLRIIVPRKYMHKISAVGLFCCDKFEGTPKQKVINMSKLNKLYFSINEHRLCSIPHFIGRETLSTTLWEIRRTKYYMFLMDRISFEIHAFLKVNNLWRCQKSETMYQIALDLNFARSNIPNHNNFSPSLNLLHATVVYSQKFDGSLLPFRVFIRDPNQHDTVL